MSPAAIAVAGSCCLVLGLVVAGRPKLVVGLAFCGVISSRSLAQVTGVPLLGYLDEGLVCVVFARYVLLPFVMGRRVRSFPGLAWFAVFAALGLVGAHVADVPLLWALQAAFLLLKGVLFGWSVAQLPWTERDIRYVVRWGCAITIAVLVAGAVNLVVPAAWTGVLANDGQPNERGFVPSVIGPFVHPGEFGVTTALATIAVVAWIATHRATTRNVPLLVAALVGCLLSFRRKSAVGLAVTLTWLGLQTNRTRTVLVLLLAAPLALLASWTTLSAVATSTAEEYLSNPDGTARIVLTLGALDVANDHFPLGAGFARYGSPPAQTHYSPEYTARGFDGVWGLGAEDVNGFALTDAMWPAILGEAGYLGAAAFAGGLMVVFRQSRRHRSTSNADVRWLALVVGGWSVHLAVESVAMATYSTPPVFPLVFGAAGLLYAIRSEPAIRSDTAVRGDPAVQGGTAVQGDPSGAAGQLRRRVPRSRVAQLSGTPPRPVRDRDR